jgi:2-polyprenyl-3-methyl-5-hydroxy-6-metoxy-1,4-benzoquinol methylase
VKKGLLRIMTLPERVRNFILFLFFHFDRWHISPSSNRIYPGAIIDFVQKYSLDDICEIGCGLGDTISKLNGKNMIGLDYDENVLKAASLLHKKNHNLRFEKFVFPSSALEGSYNLIIAVNWIHSYDEDTIKTRLLLYFVENLKYNGFLILDSIRNKGYKYCHDFSSYFSGLNCTIIEIGHFPSSRTVYAIQKLM